MDKNIHQELEELSPLLLEMRKQPEGYEVPEGYFAMMQQEVLAKLQVEMQPPIVVPTVKTKSSLQIGWEKFLVEMEYLFQPRYAVAFASLVLVLGAGWFVLKPQNADNVAITEIPLEEIDIYLEENIDDIDTEQLWKHSTNEIAETTPHQVIHENKPATETKKLKDANEHEINEMIDEMIQNGELSEEDLDEIL
jgi:hypothetical protein